MKHAAPALRRNTLSVVVRASLASFVAITPAHASLLYVYANGDSGTGTLRDAVTAATDGDTIVFDCSVDALNCPATITLTSQGNNQGFPGPTALSIKSKAITIQGPVGGGVTLKAAPGGSSSTSLRHFFVDTDASLTLTNLTLSGGHAIGGTASSGGGGAAGLGGAIFSQGSLTLSGVNFSGNAASGGNGGGGRSVGFFWNGGGGLGGDGGGFAQGGGGGTGGNGGGRTDGGDHQIGGVGGPGLGGSGGGAGGYYSYATPGQSTAATSGSGGGGGGNGVWNSGGNGSEGGGGGGGYANDGGGNGGFGGGGGSSTGAASGPGGNGGFGAGGGAGFVAGNGGVGGGNGGYCHYVNEQSFFGCGGGSGGGFGGAIFARAGSILIQNNSGGGLISGNGVNAGAAVAADNGHSGTSAGSGLFLMSGVTTTLDIAGSYTIEDSIDDDSPVSLPAGGNYTPGDGAGVEILKQGAGTLILSGANHNLGGATINGGTLQLDGSVRFVVVNDSGVLSGSGVTGSIAMNAGGFIAPGGSPGTLSALDLTWHGGGAIDFMLGADSAGSDLLALTDVLAKGGSSGFAFHFEQGWPLPATGVAYTLIQFGSTTFEVADFSFDIAPPLTSLQGTFSLEANALKFTITSVTSDRVFGDDFE